MIGVFLIRGFFLILCTGRSFTLFSFERKTWKLCSEDSPRLLQVQEVIFFVEVTREFIDVYYFPEHRQTERQNPCVATVYM